MKLGDYYRREGESEHLRRVEDALGDSWRSTQEIADEAGTSYNYTRAALAYLLEEKRVEQTKEAARRGSPVARGRLLWRSPG